MWFWFPSNVLICSYKYWVPYPEFEWMNGFDDVDELSNAYRWPECGKH